MAERSNNNGLSQIRQGLKDVERLLGQKHYNLAMIRSRQTLEMIVNIMKKEAGIVDTADLRESIDALYSNKMISAATRDHYHKIRSIGNKAVHEGDNNAYNANTAFTLLSPEVYAFMNAYSPERRNRAAVGSKSTNQRRIKKKRRKIRIGDISLPFSAEEALKALLVILVIAVVLVVLIKVAGRKKEAPAETMAETIPTVATAPVQTLPPQTTAAPQTEPETMAPEIWKITGDAVRIRSTPDKSSDANIIDVLPMNTILEGVEDYDETWAKFTYNGKDAYIAKQFIAKQ